MKTAYRPFALAFLSLLLFSDVTAVGGNTLIISEFRLRGPNGANDEFIEIYNNSGSDHTVAGGGTGYSLVASDGVARATIPNGTVIPARGHYLIVNSVGYSLSNYPAGNGTTATGDATYTTDIPDNAGIALFNSSMPADFTLANRLDAVGSTSEANTLYKEGSGYAALTPFSIDYSFVRKYVGSTGSNSDNTVCPAGTPANTAAVLYPQDTDNNASDFLFVDTNGTSAGAGQRLGSPGPENLSSPISGIPTPASTVMARIDTAVGSGASPNQVRDATSDPANNSTFGTLDVRRKYTNNTGVSITRLRFRIFDVATFPAPSGRADLRPRTSATLPAVATSGGPVEVQGTTLEQPPSQPNGGGFNSTLSVPSVTLATPLAAGASINVRFLLGIQQTGRFNLFIVPEALPSDSGHALALTGDTQASFTHDCTTVSPGSLVISEFRLRGPNGANDEFIEVYNNGNADVTVVSSDGSPGYGIAASDGVVRAVIPNGTVIPKGGHFLAVNSVGYSLAAYPAGNGTTAAGDVTYTTDIPDNAGIALFTTRSAGNLTLANRLDAVGPTSEANTLYKEGTGYPALTPFSIDYSFSRKFPLTLMSMSTVPNCPAATGAHPQDTNNNADDFQFVDTNGTSAGAGQRLGAPGPQNLSSPRWGVASVASTTELTRIDTAVSSLAAPNKVRDFTSDPANNSTFGTLDIRRKYTNTSGVNITRLRFRIIHLTTFPEATGTADLRPRTSTAVVVSTSTGNVTVQGTTVEEPPSQPNGSGLNGSLSAGTVTLATPLAPGDSVNLRFLFGIQQTGAFRFFIVPEALPAEPGYAWGVYGNTDTTTGTDCDLPLTATSTALTSAPNPSTIGQNVTLTATVSPNTATGTVTFKNGATTLGTGTIASGQATFMTNSLAIGTHSLTAEYGGDGGHDASTSPAHSHTVNNKTATTTTITSSANPSMQGTPVTITAMVSPGGATGTVTFKVGGTAVGTGTLSAGRASVVLTVLSPGSHQISAEYGGDAFFFASTSPVLVQVVNASTTATATTTALASSENPSGAGQAITLTATVSPSAATGTVTFKNGATVLGTGTLTAGQAALNVSTLTIGTHSLTAEYEGDANHSPSVSPALSQVVKAPSTTALTTSPNPSTYGSAVTLTATVTPSSAPGTVTFRAGSMVLGTCTLASGTCTSSIDTLTAGAHAIAATYEGSAELAPSTSPEVSQNVSKATITATVVQMGQTVTVTLTSSAGTPTGTITLLDGAMVLEMKPVTNGMAVFTLPMLSEGMHSLSATYSGDTNFAPAMSPPIAVTVPRADAGADAPVPPPPPADARPATDTPARDGGVAPAPDARPADTGTPPAPDAGATPATDARPADAGATPTTDARPVDGATTQDISPSGGCSCSTAAGSSGSAPLWLLVLGAALIVRRAARRRR